MRAVLLSSLTFLLHTQVCDGHALMYQVYSSSDPGNSPNPFLVTLPNDVATADATVITVNNDKRFTKSTAEPRMGQGGRLDPICSRTPCCAQNGGVKPCRELNADGFCEPTCDFAAASYTGITANARTNEVQAPCRLAGDEYAGGGYVILETDGTRNPVDGTGSATTEADKPCYDQPVNTPNGVGNKILPDPPINVASVNALSTSLRAAGCGADKGHDPGFTGFSTSTAVFPPGSWVTVTWKMLIGHNDDRMGVRIALEKADGSWQQMTPGGNPIDAGEVEEYQCPKCDVAMYNRAKAFRGAAFNPTTHKEDYCPAAWSVGTADDPDGTVPDLDCKTAPVFGYTFQLPTTGLDPFKTTIQWSWTAASSSANSDMGFYIGCTDIAINNDATLPAYPPPPPSPPPAPMTPPSPPAPPPAAVIDYFKKKEEDSKENAAPTAAASFLPLVLLCLAALMP